MMHVFTPILATFTRDAAIGSLVSFGETSQAQALLFNDVAALFKTRSFVLLFAIAESVNGLAHLTSGHDGDGEAASSGQLR